MTSYFNKALQVYLVTVHIGAVNKMSKEQKCVIHLLWCSKVEERALINGTHTTCM